MTRPDRITISGILHRKGYIVLEAADYWDALSMFRQNREAIDVVICDVALPPERNGCDLAIAMTGEKPELRVLFVGGHVGAQVCKYYGLQPSDVYFLRKPFAAPDLVDRLNTILKSTKPLPVRSDVRAEKSTVMA